MLCVKYHLRILVAMHLPVLRGTDLSNRRPSASSGKSAQWLGAQSLEYPHMSTKKNLHRFMAVLGSIATLLAGCNSSSSSNPSNIPASSVTSSSDEFRPPARGETMDEVHAQY